MDNLQRLRTRIEELDRQLAVLIADRLRVCSQVARVKKAEGIPMMQPHRVTAVRAAYAERGRELGVSPDFMTRFAVLLVDEACRLENEIIEDRGAALEGGP